MAKTTKLPQTEAEWKRVEHYFARGRMVYGRGLTVKDAIAQALNFMSTGPRYAPYRRATAFDVWRVPAGETLLIDDMGTVNWSDGCERVHAAKVNEKRHA